MLPPAGAGSSGFHGGQGMVGKRGGGSPPATPPNKRTCGNPAAASNATAEAGGAMATAVHAKAKAGPAALRSNNATAGSVTLVLDFVWGIYLNFAQVKQLFPSLLKPTVKAAKEGFLAAPDGRAVTVTVSVKEPGAPAGRKECQARLVYSEERKWRLLGLEKLDLWGCAEQVMVSITAWVKSEEQPMMDPVGAEPSATGTAAAAVEPAAVLGCNAAGASAAAAAQAPATSTARDTRASPTALPRTNSPAGKSYFTDGTIPAAAAAPFVTVPACPIGDAAGDASATTASAARADGASSAAVDSSGGRAARAAPATPAAPIIAAGAAAAASNVITASAAKTAGAAPATPTAGANSTVATYPPNSASSAPGAASAATTATADPAARSTPDINAAIDRAVADANVAVNRVADAVTASRGFICLVLPWCYTTARASTVLLLEVDGLMAPLLHPGGELTRWVKRVATFAGCTAIEYRVVRPGSVARGASGPLAVAVWFDAAVTVEVVEKLRSKQVPAVPLSRFPTNKALLDSFMEAAEEQLPVGDKEARTVGMHRVRVLVRVRLEQSEPKVVHV